MRHDAACSTQNNDGNARYAPTSSITSLSAKCSVELENEFSCCISQRVEHEDRHTVTLRNGNRVRLARKLLPDGCMTREALQMDISTRSSVIGK
ncbi:hypothetical protein KCU89_g139, partial [Aureobasidium melanogenum]